MRRKLTPAFVAKPPLPDKGDRVIYWDASQAGFGLMVTMSGHRPTCASTVPPANPTACI